MLGLQSFGSGRSLLATNPPPQNLLELIKKGQEGETLTPPTMKL